MTINVEALLVSEFKADPYLTGEGFRVSAQVPSTRKNGDRLVTVERVGGPRDTHRDLPLVSVLVWTESRWQASEYASHIADVLEQLAYTHPNVARVTVTSTYNNPDPDSNHQRYQVNAELVTKET